MKPEELEQQSRRIEQGKKLQSEIQKLRDLYERVRGNNSFFLATDRFVSCLSWGYTNSDVANQGWIFDLLSNDEIREQIEHLKNKMLTKISEKIEILKKEFEEL